MGVRWCLSRQMSAPHANTFRKGDTDLWIKKVSRFPLCVFTKNSCKRSENGAQQLQNKGKERRNKGKGQGKGSRQGKGKGRNTHEGRVATTTAVAAPPTAAATVTTIAKTPSGSAAVPASGGYAPWYIHTSGATPPPLRRSLPIAHISHGYEEPWEGQRTGWGR